MKRALLLLALLAPIAVAASHDSSPAVTVHLAALDTNSNSFYFRGPLELKYAVEVTNPANEPITLRRLDLHSAGGGAYTLRAASTPMNVKVAPNSNASFSITTWARSRGGEMGSSEPVVILGRAYFDSPKGPFVKVFQENVVPGL